MNQYVDQAFKSIQFFSEKYGKYPYPEFRIAETYLEHTAFEYARVIQMGPLQKNADATQDFVFVHEIAHQWFHSSL
ncbi:hypothetical protein [Paenibacillus guangzhouensis]|uniref:hypothetical protein n=1 Tax=Paenibacillus guangzhouensis TaxID=1473112 RepID=UPI00187B4C7B|nr:hypothetical protein [Paenibacillus guangzhouensis]